MSEEVKCEFCNKEFSNISNLKYHQKNAKFCLELQNQKQTNHKCEHCNKEFSSDKYLKQHASHCKVFKDKQELIKVKAELNEIKVRYELREQEFKKELKTKEQELEYKLKAKDDIIKLKNESITKLEKENEKYQKLISRPTTIYNTDNSTTNHNNNYQIQYNQLLDKIQTLNTENLSKRINSIEVKDVYTLDVPKFETNFSNKLSNIFKEFTFCINNTKKVVVMKNDKGETKELNIKDFINMCIQLGMTDIDNILLKINNHHEQFMDNLETEEFTPLDDYLTDARLYLKNKKDKTSVDDEKHPFKQITQGTLSSCEHLSKK
jgi:hypothetical protein